MKKLANRIKEVFLWAKYKITGKMSINLVTQRRNEYLRKLF